MDNDYRKGDVIEIVIRDNSKRKIEQFKANLNDKKLCRKIFSIIEHKYDFVKIDNQTSKQDDIIKKESNWLDLESDFLV